MTNKIKTFRYSESDKEELLENISRGETVRSFCRHKKIPHSTCFAWIYKSFPEQYAQAREEAADYWADEIINIAYDNSKDYKKNSKGENIIDNDSIQRAKLKIDTIKWHLAKIAPKKYGDKLELAAKVDTNITTSLPPEISEMIGEVKKAFLKGDENNEDSPINS